MRQTQAKAKSIQCDRLPKGANAQMPRGGVWETRARQATLEGVERKLVMEDVRNQMEEQSEEQRTPNRHKLLCEKTRSGQMRGAIQALTGEGVAEGDEKTEKEINKLVMEEPAPSDTKFAEEVTTARKTLFDRGASTITVRTVTTRLRSSKNGCGTWSTWPEELPHRDDRGS